MTTLQKISQFLKFTHYKQLDNLINRVTIIDDAIIRLNDLPLILRSSIDDAISVQLSNINLTITQEQIDDIKTYAIQQATAQAKIYTDSQIDIVKSEVAIAKLDAIAAAKLETDTKADAAKLDAIATAKLDADTKATKSKSDAIAAAKLDTDTKAYRAKIDAIAAAAIDAETKAGQAKIDAIAGANLYTDAQAIDAQAAAIAAAAIDATTKATNAYNAAVAYTDSKVTRK